ncbi:exported protein of unknown function [Candidatus Filomicrobium marinum]|uniref:Uncharacterized protein n=1 Tax=Candidatus Filomicrobium marinum TaxID=1608628 RepID=A0A0D6JBR0_9HYPH|nr:exported protein of unknown function [Candidatus Filomicrobium marinum]CPR16509.1 exported protein of unknown function [Candidatus Filomicrobium marinum]
MGRPRLRSLAAIFSSLYLEAKNSSELSDSLLESSLVLRYKEKGPTSRRALLVDANGGNGILLRTLRYQLSYKAWA